MGGIPQGEMLNNFLLEPFYYKNANTFVWLKVELDDFNVYFVTRMGLAQVHYFTQLFHTAPLLSEKHL